MPPLDSSPMPTPVFLQAALNGDSGHPATPRTPLAIAQAALAVVRAGAHSVHVHAFDATGRETLAPHAYGAVLRAIRHSCPGLPVSLTTSAAIVPDPEERLRQVQAWEVLPDLVTANQGEAGINVLVEHLLARGVELEAGLMTVADARAFVASGLAARYRRVLIEPLELEVGTALQNVAAIEEVVLSAGITLEQVHHGYGIACWAVNRRALDRGHGIRTGLEDISVLPNGTPAADNGALVEAASHLIEAHRRARAAP